MITFTKITNSKGLLSKTAELVDGQLVRKGATQLSQGTFETIQCPFEDFGNFLTSLTTNDALLLGIAKGGKNSGKITSKSRAGEGLTRTKDNFEFGQPALILLDFDGGNWNSMEEGLEAVLAVVPALRGRSYWLYPSSSSYLNWEGGSRELKGFHVYTTWDYDIETLKRELVYGFRASGQETFMLSAGLFPSVLKRYPCDLSVFAPERLVYAAGSECGTGVTQLRPAPILVSDDSVPSLLVTDEMWESSEAMSADAKAAFAKENDLKGARERARGERARLSGTTEKAAAVQDRFLEQGKIPGSLKILLDSGEWIPCWKFLIGDEYNKITCHDPLEPDYDAGAQNKAVIFCGGGSATIISHAHGTHAYDVEWDQASIMEALEKMSENDLEKGVGEGWLAQLYTQQALTDVEREELLEPMRKKLSTGKEKAATLSAVKSKIAAGAGKVQKDRVEEALEGYNQRFATAEIGGAFRVLKEVQGRDGFLYYDDQKDEDFKKAMAGDKVVVWDGAKPKLIPVAKMWLEWEKRRHYHQVTFNPDREESEWWTGGSDGVGERVLNQFRGFVCKPVAGRACGKNRGCFPCFFTDTEDGGCGLEVCSHDVRAGGGVTYWLKHILDHVCHGRVDHAKWVVDWISDCIRNPGGDRPDTALIVYGEEKGTGKGATIWPALALLNGAAMHTADTELLVGRFNSHLERMVLIFADEAMWGTGKTVSSRAKNLVDGKSLNIERKGIDIYTVKNHVRVFAASNNERAWPVETGERRAACFEIGTGVMQNREWFGKFFHRTDLLPVFLDEMKNGSSLGSDLHLIPSTEALLDQKGIGNIGKVEVAFVAWALD